MKALASIFFSSFQHHFSRDYFLLDSNIILSVIIAICLSLQVNNIRLAFLNSWLYKWISHQFWIFSTFSTNYLKFYEFTDVIDAALLENMINILGELISSLKRSFTWQVVSGQNFRPSMIKTMIDGRKLFCLKTSCLDHSNITDWCLTVAIFFSLKKKSYTCYAVMWKIFLNWRFSKKKIKQKILWSIILLFIL